MRIRIVRQPRGSVEGISLDRYRPGESYDVSAGLANYLVAEGFAVFEQRGEKTPQPPKEPDRRKPK